jgi:glycosyltransferase involved in cell wall biosynthesis
METSVEISRTRQRRRVLVLPAEYPDLTDPLEFNGSWAEEQTQVIAQRYQVAVVYPLLIRQGPPVVEEHRSPDLTTYIVRYRHLRKSWLLSYGWAVLRGVRAARLRPECIHAQGLYPSAFVALGLGRWLGIPVVVTEHWGRLGERVRGSRLMEVILPLTLRGATSVVAVSEALASEMVGIEPRCRPVVVSNTVLPDFFDLPLANVRSGVDALRLLFVGSLHDQRKGLGDLLHAIALYTRSPEAVRVELTIIGDGKARGSFEGLAAKLGLSNSCIFLGNQPRSVVVRAMGECHALAVPSRYETFGVVFAEAMAAGKPVIACLGGPAEEVIPPWAGVLVPTGDTQALSRAIDRVVRDHASFDGFRSRSYARDRFGPEAFLEAITVVYEQAMGSLHGGER